MKWYFAISEASPPGNSYIPSDSSYVDMVRVAVRSASEKYGLGSAYDL
jgi:hypothetical protein